MATDYSIAEWNGLRIAWTPALDGGGRVLRHDFDAVVAELFGHVGRLFEFCAGPGFIGFSLLSLGLCDHLVLADVNPRAVEAARETVRSNGLEDRVTIYESDGLEDIPQDERWDLVVSNPPHFAVRRDGQQSLILDDPGWRLHRHFYARVGKHLTPGGSILFEENSEGSNPGDFTDMIMAGGLIPVRTLWSTTGISGPYFYFMWVKEGRHEDALADEPTNALTVRLRETAADWCRTPADEPCAIRLVNDTGRTVTPMLVNSAGVAQLSAPLEPLQPGAMADLPLLALPAGEYQVPDADSTALLARLEAIRN